MNILIVFGTRPEIIKLYPLIKALPDAYLVWTGQHDKLAQNLLEEFDIQPDENLKVMVKGASLSKLTYRLHKRLDKIYQIINPSLVIVQGDTTSAMVAALEAFYHKIPVAHIEAGLRSRDAYNPFPEEVNRRLITQVATYNFTPTPDATVACAQEGWGHVYQVGQTGIDTLLEFARGESDKKEKILVTLHRRENKDKVDEIFKPIADFVAKTGWQVDVIIHPNGTIKKVPPYAKAIKPLGYKDMIRAMQEASIIVTDSGGIQEEAACLKTPCFVARKVTEREEGVVEGFARMLNGEIYKFLVPNKQNPYGDGKATRRILKWLV